MEPTSESRLDAILAPDQVVSVTAALERAREAGHEVEVGQPSGDLRWTLEAPEWRAGLGPAPRKALEVMAEAGRLPPELAAPGTMALSVFTHLPPDCLEAYRAQLCVVRTLAPESAAVFDANAYTVLQTADLDDLTTVPVPPPPTRLYSVHVVIREGLAWLHTHGLQRCGAVEIELVDVPRERVSDMKALLHAAAARLIEEAAPPGMCTAFEVSRETNLVWIPWAKMAAKGIVKGPGTQRSSCHTRETGVLLAKPSRWQRKAFPHEVIQGRPRVLVSRAESIRMAAGARARWDRFRALFEEHRRDEAWRFLIKAAFDTAGPCGREHLWMDLRAATADGWSAQIVSDPCRASLSRGDTIEGALDSLSGFEVRAPSGTFGPDDLVRVERHEAVDGSA